MRTTWTVASLVLALGGGVTLVHADEKVPPGTASWRSLPLIKEGKVAGGWTHLGYGRFVVDGDSLRTECDPRGMGLLVYEKEKFGNCQIRIVYRSDDAKDNSGVYVRMAKGILEKTKKPAPVQRAKDGSLNEKELEKLKVASEGGDGPWFAVHHGYEVQIQDDADPYHRTGAIYSLAKAVEATQKRPEEWKTMIITLRGNIVEVSLDGRPITSFDPASKEVPARKEWYEPKREPKRPEVGYLGLQTHDPGDVVYFREVSVRPLPGKE